VDRIGATRGLSLIDDDEATDAPVVRRHVVDGSPASARPSASTVQPPVSPSIKRLPMCVRGRRGCRPEDYAMLAAHRRGERRRGLDGTISSNDPVIFDGVEALVRR
jgi:hypothetical protein